MNARAAIPASGPRSSVSTILLYNAPTLLVATKGQRDAFVKMRLWSLPALSPQRIVQGAVQ
jgi:hypothetical protein